MPARATSPFLNLPLRTEREARAACEQAEWERRRRLEYHGAGFCRAILDGAFERVHQSDDSYRLRAIWSGAWLEDLPGGAAETSPPDRGFHSAGPGESDAPDDQNATVAEPQRRRAFIKEENPMSIHGYFTLRAAVKVAVAEGPTAVWKDGIITGRTLEQNARYDVLFSDGTMERNVTADRIRPRDDGRYF